MEVKGVVRRLMVYSFLGRSICTLTLLAIFYGTLCALGWAQETWPNRPIRLIVPLTAGGGVDLMARITAQHLSDQLGQQMVVENEGGAGGTIAANMVAHSRPDGYTLIFQSVSSAVVNALVYKNLQYDPIKDLIPVTLAGSFPLVLIVNSHLPAKDLSELIRLLKADPGKYSYGSSGVGTMPYLAGELFQSMAGVDVVHVPYRGNSAVMVDLFAGRIAMMFTGPPGNIQSGKVRALAYYDGGTFAGASRHPADGRHAAGLRDRVLDCNLCACGHAEGDRRADRGGDQEGDERSRGRAPLR
jgi:tripartite-type tricarboxylate transporter receptor subunit TctC